MDGIQLKEWLEHPVTKAVFKNIQDEIEDLKAQLVGGCFDHSSCEIIAISVVKMAAKIEGMERLIQLKRI